MPGASELVCDDRARCKTLFAQGMLGDFSLIAGRANEKTPSGLRPRG